MYTLYNEDCLEAMKKLEDNSIDSIVTDPPYGLSTSPDITEVLTHWLNDKDYVHSDKGFMGKSWDSFVPNPSYWKEAYRVLKPGGHGVVFAGTRTVDLMGISLRLAGFEIRDTIVFLHAQGFPKSLNISKAIDVKLGLEQEVLSEVKTNSGGMSHISKTNKEQGFRPNEYNGHSLESDYKNVIQKTKPNSDIAQKFSGFGTGLKPAIEQIILIRKPISENTIAENVMKWNTGGINIDDCRIATIDGKPAYSYPNGAGGWYSKEYQQNNKLAKDWNAFSTKEDNKPIAGNDLGRFPANFIHDSSNEVMKEFDSYGNHKCSRNKHTICDEEANTWGGTFQVNRPERGYDDEVTIARFYKSCPVDEDDYIPFFYSAKTSTNDRNEGCNKLKSQKDFITTGKGLGYPISKCLEHNTSLPNHSSLHYTCGCERVFDNEQYERKNEFKNHHPTVKSFSLMSYLCRLVTPKDGTILDCFMGSGSTGKAAIAEGFKFVGIELEKDYFEVAKVRIEHQYKKENPISEDFFKD